MVVVVTVAFSLGGGKGKNAPEVEVKEFFLSVPVFPNAPTAPGMPCQGEDRKYGEDDVEGSTSEHLSSCVIQLG
ncbi:Protein of unknown function [Gryllus bimaculatus]|nr:Protein of unknown function [Gryllus bimaculatus]